MTHRAMIAAKRALAPGPKSSGLIKGDVALQPGDGLVPGYSASGQDVWLQRTYAPGAGPGLVLSAVGARCGKVFLADHPSWGTVANTVSWSVAPGWDPKYTHYLFNREEFWIKGGSAQPYVQVEASLAQPIVIWTLHDQLRLAEYLDRETAQIDALIGKQGQLVATLTERRQVVIAQAVTRGLDPDTKLRDSRVAWMGRVPNHWHLGQVKHFGEVRLGKMIQPEQKEPDQIRAPYMRAANVQPGGQLAPDDIKQMWFGLKELGGLTLRAGDVVVVEGGMGGYGRAAYLKEELEGWGFQNSINRIRLHSGDGRYLTYLLLTARAVGFITAVCAAVSMPHFTAEKLARLDVPLPPDGEQREIANYIDDATSKIDALIAKAREMTAVLRERRQALISAAVTGKIDVRGL